MRCYWSLRLYQLLFLLKVGRDKMVVKPVIYVEHAPNMTSKNNIFDKLSTMSQFDNAVIVNSAKNDWNWYRHDFAKLQKRFHTLQSKITGLPFV